MRVHCLLVLFAATPLLAQRLTFAEGTPAALQIVTVSEASPNSGDTVVLQNAELLPLEISDRTLAQELDTTRARRTVRHGIARVELPGGGRLFRYRRANGQFWGLLWIAADGDARVALEQPGIGAAGTSDPFVDRIAVAQDGLHAAVARATGGGLYVLRLDGGTYGSTGRIDRFVASNSVVETAVLVGAQNVFFQTNNDRLWRLGLGDGSQPVDVSPPAVHNGEWKDQMVISGDGARVVFLYGPRDQQRLFLLGDAGAAGPLPPPPSKYEEPGYLPEDPGEPAMLLDYSGSRLFYVDSIVRDELFLLDTSGALPTLQITQDSIFQPYIGVHILPKFRGPQLLLAIGDPARMDWFRVDLTAAGGTVANLTGTGTTLPPFAAGTLDPQQLADAGGTLLITEQGPAASLALRRLDPATATSTLLQQDLLQPPLVGSATSGTADLLVTASSGMRLYRGDSAALFASAPIGITLSPPVHGPMFAATWVEFIAGLGAVAYYLPDGTIIAGSIETGVTQVCATAAGGFVVVGPTVRRIGLGGNTILSRPAAALRRCLSGAGG